MSFVNLKKKTTIVLLCLISFTVGCILTSQFGTTNLQTLRENVPLRLQDWSRLGLKRDHAEEISQNETLPNQVVQRTHSYANKSMETVVTKNEDELIDEYEYFDAMKMKLKKKLPDESRPTEKPVSKYHYFVEVQDPRSSMILRKVISKLPTNLMKSVVSNSGLNNPNKFANLKNPAVVTQKKWALLIDGMQKLGYEQRLPIVLNIGVKKSGTNAFGFFIGHHPQISHSIGNEVHYFDWNYNRGIEYYRSRMSFSKAESFSFEKTPRYFITHDTPKNIKKDLPGNLKFIICVRDPVERAKSEFRHEAELKMRRGKKSRTTIQKEAKAQTSASQGKLFEKTVLASDGHVNSSNEIVDTSVYSRHFKNWLEYFPRESFYILSDERVNKDIYTELKNIEKFLGLKPYFEKSMFYYDQTRHGPCMRGDARPCPAKSTPGFLPKAEPQQEVINKLRDFYRPYNQEFEKLSQMTFSWTNL
ncbi:heparan sulfate glucosamine 3-O-sulfotransferase 5-like [Asterias rubens]|uniref:heparan sulfate glucosamine 3-O-sulfotransferase 5-like n=1 Tax=Asterias rubens TaxID=7604 RepID=UPI00145559A9|nr:heparan sulfate glucosamine 3-O-sulfotransferase 5-like [Asterias rubens]